MVKVISLVIFIGNVENVEVSIMDCYEISLAKITRVRVAFRQMYLEKSVLVLEMRVTY